MPRGNLQCQSFQARSLWTDVAQGGLEQGKLLFAYRTVKAKI